MPEKDDAKELLPLACEVGDVLLGSDVEELLLADRTWAEGSVSFFESGVTDIVVLIGSAVEERPIAGRTKAEGSVTLFGGAVTDAALATGLLASFFKSVLTAESTFTIRGGRAFLSAL
jgi:hypothetical protein